LSKWRTLVASASEGERSQCHSLRRNERGLGDGDRDEGLKARRERADVSRRVGGLAAASRGRNCPIPRVQHIQALQFTV